MQEEREGLFYYTLTFCYTPFFASQPGRIARALPTYLLTFAGGEQRRRQENFMNQQNNEHVWDFSEWEDEALTREWNRLDGAEASAYNENKADAIEKECARRRIVAWDADGMVTQREEW